MEKLHQLLLLSNKMQTISHTHAYCLHQNRYTTWIFCVCVCVCLMWVTGCILVPAASACFYSRLTSPRWPAAGFQLGVGGASECGERPGWHWVSSGNSHLASCLAASKCIVQNISTVDSLLQRPCKTDCNWTCLLKVFYTTYLSLMS